MLQELAGMVFPSACPGCGIAAEPVCGRCAATLVAAPDSPAPLGVEEWAAAFVYTGVARELVARLKYRNARAALGWLARAAAGAASTLDLRGAVVTWVPTTPERRRGRGFDHAELLARSTAARLGLPVEDLLRRSPGPAQTGRARSERRHGLRYLPRRRRMPRSILLVDDVSTTGASIAAAATTLRDSGARYVRAVTIARTPDPSHR